MANIVFVLGAGASAQGGCPVMCDFFERAFALAQSDDLGEFVDDFAVIEALREQLHNSQIKAAIDSANLETVYNLIETGIFLGGLGPLKEADLVRARSSLIRLIVGVLERTQQFQVVATSSDEDYLVRAPAIPIRGGGTRSPQALIGPAGYCHLAGIASTWLNGRPRHRISVLTFNYDTGLEASLMLKRVPFVYALGTTEPPSDHVAVYKLHGSSNWLRPRTPNDPILHDLDSLREAFTKVDPHKIGRSTLRTFADFRERATKAGRDPVPFIIPPAANKQGELAAVRSMWQHAGEAIGTADVIAVIGYSLPATDVFFREFYCASSMTPHRLRRFIVGGHQGDPDGKFARLTGLLLRPVFQHLTADFDGCLRSLTDLHATTKGCF